MFHSLLLIIHNLLSVILNQLLTEVIQAIYKIYSILICECHMEFHVSTIYALTQDVPS